MVEFGSRKPNASHTDRMETLMRFRRSIDTVLLRDDTKYFADFKQALENALLTGDLLPDFPDYLDLSSRYQNRGDGTPIEKMVLLHNEARDLWIDAYNCAHLERRGREPSLELSLIPEEPRLVGDVIPLIESEEYSRLSKEFKEFLNAR